MLKLLLKYSEMKRIYIAVYDITYYSVDKFSVNKFPCLVIT